MMASTVADNVSMTLSPLSANPSRNRLRLRARAPMIASAYTYVATRLGYEPALFDPAAYPARSRQRHCKTIESLSGFRAMDDGHEKRLVEAIDRQVAAHDTPKAIFYAAVETLTTEKAVLPRRWRPEMAEITDKELEALQDGFDTLSLVHAVDELDKMRGHLNDREHHNPPEIRDDILKLHV